MTKNWMSVHIFYNGYMDPMIVDCIGPLVKQLRELALIQRYFFIRYWQEGTHVRLRLLPAEGITPEEIKQVIEPAIERYMKEHPALYEVDESQVATYFKTMFIAEYGEDRWIKTYGEDGVMPLRPNNSIAYIDYEPEYGRYGGVEGIEIAEWHFEKSSDIVRRLIDSTNIHVRSILLGISVQLSLALCYGFLEDDQKVIVFLKNYMKFWQENYQKSSSYLYTGFEKKYARMAGNLQRRVLGIRSGLLQSATTRLTQTERGWIDHIRELRQKVDGLVRAGKFVYQTKEGEPLVIENLDAAYSILLSSYVHMTNNRLGVVIADEVYLSYILIRSIEEILSTTREVAS